MGDCFQFEYFPDEILLEIYRYLHCGHILYSFYNLNFRLNQTLTHYCQYVILRRLTYQQFTYIYSQIIPEIGHQIRSLTINRLQQNEFLKSFSFKMENFFPNLEKLALDDWKNLDLFPFVSSRLSKLTNLRQIIIRGLRQPNDPHSLVTSIDDSTYLFEIVSENRQIETIIFEPDCYSMTLLNHKKFRINHSNLIELNLSLSTSDHLNSLAYFLPNLRRLYVIIEEIGIMKEDILPFQRLTHFSLDAIESYSKLENLRELFQIIPTVEHLSLVLTSIDERLIYGEHFLQCLSLKTFQYAVYFSSSIDYCFDSRKFFDSWKSHRLVYTINKDQKRSYIFIHTVPYPSILLNLQSTLTNKFGVRSGDQVYRIVQYLYVNRMKTLKEIFPILQHCRKTQDLTIQIDGFESVSAVSSTTERIPKLKSLEILSIFGRIDNWLHFKYLIHSAHNLTTLCLDLPCAMKLFELNDEEIVFPRVLHLYLDGHRCDLKLTSEHICQLARIFSEIHSLKIKYKTEDVIDGRILGEIVDKCQHLTVVAVNGQILENISSNDLSPWLMKYSLRLKKYEKMYQIQLIENFVEIWL
ncbi:unnamed protein product [Adineta ricciae]|uniref:F-box domain-containing protein n=1 Tax=Adineta ricciae TaxID=249248 RepID=A0A813XNX8_ADIRI|nr:unnamed protein product [Adineta ricciae]CAF1155151.1 unnamed protein product [Adineta ricciae]